MRIADLSIGKRLAAGYILLLALLAGVAALGINGMREANEAMRHVVEVNEHKISLLEEMSRSVHIVSRVMRTIVLLSDEAAGRAEQGKIDGAREKYNAAFAALKKMPIDAAGQALVARIDAHQALARPLNDKFLALARRDKEAAIAQLLKENGPATEQWQQTLLEYIHLQEEKSKADEVGAEHAYRRAQALMLALTAAAMLAGGLIGWFSTRSITLPIGAAVKVARTVAAGDLSGDIRVTSSDETGQLMQALKDMNDSLVGIVGQVRTGTDTITTASGEIATGNLDLSSRTERQASALEETASSMEELTSTVKHNASNARQANELAIAASGVALKGGAVVAQVVQTMGSINDSSKKIVDIIGVIDGIAFQTNILALNAAVEAARAGEQGRGFAVVASEVRNLAQRSAAAAKEIKALIDASVGQVDLGARLVGQAGATMQDIVSSIKGVADVLGEITAASREQSSGIEQINQAIVQMDQVTQQNAALVEQAAACAASLREQAEQLARAVAVFTVGGAPARPGAALAVA